MFISKSEIPEAIEDQKQNILIYTANNLAIVNGMVPCVFSQQVSPRRWAVGWRFTKLGTKVGDIQEDCHATFDKAQTIEWVYEPSPPDDDPTRGGQNQQNDVLHPMGAS